MCTCTHVGMTMYRKEFPLQVRSGNDGDGTGKEVISHFMLVTPRLSKSFKTRVYSHITCAIKKKERENKDVFKWSKVQGCGIVAIWGPRCSPYPAALPTEPLHSPSGKIK